MYRKWRRTRNIVRGKMFRWREMRPFYMYSDVRKRSVAAENPLLDRLKCIIVYIRILFYNYIKIYFLIVNTIINEYYKHFISAHLFRLSFFLSFFCRETFGGETRCLSRITEASTQFEEVQPWRTGLPCMPHTQLAKILI